jgi:hypothetical protein
VSKAKKTIHTISKEKFEELAELANWNGTAFRDEDGVMWYTRVMIKNYPVTVMHNATDNHYLVSIERGPGAQKARNALGVANV